MSSKKSLGLVQLDERTVEHDFTMLERFHDFSAELLRIALLGISAIGFGASKVLFPDSNGVPTHISSSAKMFLAGALIAFSISAATALLHRYSSANSMSWHIQAMRRYAHGDPAQVETADSEAQARFRNFKLSQRALAASSWSLAIGAFSLAIAVWFSI